MDNLGAILGVIVAVALGAHFRKKTGVESRTQIALIVLVAAAAGAVGGVGWGQFRMAAGSPSKADLDRATLAIRQLPLVGLVLSEHPELERTAREAAEADLRSPIKRGPDRLWLLGAKIRKEYVIPALRNTDDSSALSAHKSLQDFALYLQTKNPSLCNEFGKIGVLRPDKLDSEGATLFKRLVAAQERAYLKGRTAVARTVPNDEEAWKLLATAGFNRRDFEMLADLEKLTDTDGCATTVKLVSAPGRLPTSDGSLLSRYLLTAAK